MYIFYCKQKTAYEMRISDWSSDVCSSDLLALVQVLVKACGDDRVADHPWLPAILANAGSYALGYEYEDRKKGIQISDEQGTRDRSFHFRVDFDPEAVDGILHQLGLAAWHRDRPRLLVALAVTDHQGPFIVGTEAGRGD